MSATRSTPGQSERRALATRNTAANSAEVHASILPLSWAIPRKRWVVPVIVLACVALLAVGLNALIGDSVASSDALVFYTVRKGPLPIVVTERGNLESQITEEIICEVESFGGDRSGVSGTQILFIVPNGSSVKKGDLLVELDSAPLKERLDTQFLALQRAEAEKIQAESKYENQKTQNVTDQAEAELNRELAKLELDSYENEDEDGQGTFQIEMQNIEMEVQKARAAQLISRSDLEAVQLLYGLGYKSKGDLEAAKLDLLKANSDLASQMAKRRQLLKYTYTMQKKSLQGKYETSKRNLEQVKRNNESELAQAKAAKESAERAYEKEKDRYDRYTEQLEKCKIYAPQSGMVAYATSESRYSRSSAIEEGAFVRQRQKILTLPNLTKMQVNTAVHESVLDQVRVGLSAAIRVDAFPDRSYRGTVKSVAVLPDQGSWFSSDTKVYKTIVTIDEEVAQLKPGMTAVVEIDVERLENVISVPIQAIVQRGKRNWCYAGQGRGVEKRTVEVGKTNDKFVEIKEGVVEGEMVVLNPSSLLEAEEEKTVGKSADEEAENESEEEPQFEGPPRGETGDESGDTNGGEDSRDGARKKGAQQRSPGSKGKGKARQGLLATLDRNRDGKISREELPPNLQSDFDRYDQNHDGFVNAAEMAHIRANKK